MHDRPLTFRTGVVVLLLSLLALSGLIAFLLSDEGGAPLSGPSLVPAGTRPEAELAEFLGDAACASCHPSIFQTHRHSRHAATLHTLGGGRLPYPFPDHARFTGGATGLSYALERRQDRYWFGVQAPEGPREAVAEYAFGSGKTGVTLVSRAGEESIREFRMSYFPSRRRWEVTPGQRGAGADPLGKLHARAVAQRCFSCHVTTIAASRILPEPRFLGVGCEACHGPGRRHVEALREGAADHPIDNPGRWDGARVNALCGRCHRTERELDPLDTFALSQTQRFQPIGLAKSACFRGSAGRLSCVSCHDAHEDARRDAAHYEAVCRTCHAPAVAGVQAFRRSGVRVGRPERLNTRAPEHLTTVCPVNLRTGCVTCHMPQREVVRGITMADHWIRVNPLAPLTGREAPTGRRVP
jgi:hypothetical protein